MLFIDHILHAPAAFLHAWGYLLVFLLAVLEAMPVVGSLVPGHLMVIFGGFLARAGILDFWKVVLLASSGAILGDLIGYTIGRQYGASLLQKYMGRKFLKDKLAGLRNVVREHPGKSLIIGRFNIISRAFAPFIAGAEGVPLTKFMTYNVLGGVLWGGGSVLIGYAFGTSFEVAAHYVSQFFLISIIVSVVLVYLYRVAQKKGWFTQYPIYTLLLNVLSLCVFLNLLEEIGEGEIVVKIDYWVSSHISLLQSAPLTLVMEMVSFIFSTPVVIAILLALIFFLVRKKQKIRAGVVLFSSTFAAFLMWWMKQLFARPRPEGIIPAAGYSFPSGHATMAMVLFALLMYLYVPTLKSKGWFMAGIIAMVLIVGFDRIYLNVHWLSDVVAGYALGLLCVTTFVLLARLITDWRNRKHKRTINAPI